MKGSVVLSMINDGKIGELKRLAQEEVYKDTLKGDGDAKRRYSAMKRFFKYPNGAHPAAKMPCRDITVNGISYNCFGDSFSFVCTKEDIGEMEAYDNSNNDYLNINGFIPNHGEDESVDLCKSLAEAKALGYKYKKSELAHEKGFQYVLKYRNAYFKVGIFDQAFSIINDGDKSEVVYNGRHSVLMIYTSIGLCGICPFKPVDGLEDKTVIKIRSAYDDE